jgi:ABC-type phosphate/phosphonate transport system substrate-binding protein
MPLVSSVRRQQPLSAARLPELDSVREWRLAPAHYDLPELQDANAIFEKAVLARLAPFGLDFAPVHDAGDTSVWTKTLLGQACGYHYASGLRGQAALVSTPRYRTRRGEGPFVRSAVLIRSTDKADGLIDLRGAILAVDARDLGSQNLLRAEVAPLASGQMFFKAVHAEPSILAPIEAVVEGRASAALIDAVSLTHLQKHRPGLAGKLRLLTWTSRAPAAPFLTSAKASLQLVAALRGALTDATRDPSLAEVRKELLLEEFVSLPDAHYRALVHFQQMAESQGYPDLK